MSETLLQTKLHIPSLRPNVVSRPHLVERLNAGIDQGCRLILISAPAGFGKTTLVTEWLSNLITPSPSRPQVGPHPHTRSRPAWLSLDEADNDFSRWLAYFIAALQTVEPSAGEAALSSRHSQSRLTSARLPSATRQSPSPERPLTALINDIEAIRDPLIFVLDDYHLIQEQAIHEAVAFLLEHLPDNMRLVIATRADPPLPLPRLRARGQLIELREEHLRFTNEEAVAFLNGVMAFGLSNEAVAALERRTEGWIAGLQLAALSLGERLDKERFVRSFSGSHRYVLDYLAEEVWNGQPAVVQSFLMRTAVLDRLTGSLCNALTGEKDGQATLEQLESSNLFTLPLDDERRWYRYHRLFADLLKKRLREQEPENEPTLQQRASLWFEKHGYADEAIRYSLAAGDYQRAVGLIEGSAEAALLRSEGTTLIRWVDALPEASLQERPSLRLYTAWALFMGGRPIEEVESLLPAAEDGDPVILAGADVIRAFVDLMQGQVAQSAELARQALAQLPPESLFFRSVAAWNLSLAILAEGNLEGGVQALTEATQLGKQTGNMMTAVMSMCALAELQMMLGQLQTAEETYRQALDLGRDRKGRPLPIAGMALVGLGDIARERNDLETAVEYLLQGIDLSRQWGELGALDGHIALARVKEAEGDRAGADAEIAQATRLARKLDATEMDDNLVDSHRVRLELLRGNGDAAARWAAQRGLTLEVALADLGKESQSFDLRRFRTAEYVNLIRLLMNQAQYDGGQALLDLALLDLASLDGQTLFDEALLINERLRRRAAQHNRSGVLIELFNLQALALSAQGKEPEDIAALSQALALAEPGGYARIFLDEGPGMLRLLQEAAARGIATDYVRRLLGMTGTAAAAVPAAEGPTLFEPLSEREREVLGLLVRGLSNPEIAQELFIAKSTVRSHIKNIYSKLGVHRRWDAIQRAQELGLI